MVDTADEAASEPDGHTTPDWLIALSLPALALVCAYAYWIAFLKVFHVPGSLVTVQPSDALAAFAVLFLVFLYFNGLLGVANLAIPLLPWWVRVPARNLAPWLVIGSLFGLAIRNAGFWLLYGISMVLMLGLLYVVPLFHQRNVKGYGAKLRADAERVKQNLEKDDDLFGTTPLTIVGRRFPHTMRLVAVAVLLVALAYAGGMGAAYNQREFLVTEEATPRIVIAIVADRAFVRTANPDEQGPLSLESATALPPLVSTSLSREQLEDWNVADIP